MSLLHDLGNIDETIKENYNSERLFNAADICLYECAEIVLRMTTLYEECLSGFFAIYTRKHISNLNDEALTEGLHKWHFCDNPEKRTAMLRSLKMNRDIITFPVAFVYDMIPRYLTAFTNNEPDLFNLRAAMQIRDPTKDYTQEMLHLKAAFGRYLAMRRAILEKFYRYIVKDVGRFTYGNRNLIDPEDMATEYYAALLKAFNKFDTASGAFKSYLTAWFKNARSVSFHKDEAGVAFLIPNSERKKIVDNKSNVRNFAVSMEKAPETPDEAVMRDDETVASDVNDIRLFLELLDPDGSYRLVNDMEMDIAKMFNLHQLQTKAQTVN